MSTDAPAQTTTALWMFDRHRVSAAIQTDGFRLVDVLNDRNQDTLTIWPELEASAAQGGEPEGLAVVQKANLLVAARPEGSHEAPLEQGYRFVQKTPYHIDATVGGYRVSGYVHLGQHPDPAYILAVDLEDFFPVTRAIIECPDGEEFAMSVAAVNRSRVGMLQVGRQPATFNRAV